MHTVGLCICIVSLQFSDTMRNKNCKTHFIIPPQKKSKSKWLQFSQLDKYNCLHKLHWLSYSKIHHSNKHKPCSGSWLKGCKPCPKMLIRYVPGIWAEKPGWAWLTIWADGSITDWDQRWLLSKTTKSDRKCHQIAAVCTTCAIKVWDWVAFNSVGAYYKQINT